MKRAAASQSYLYEDGEEKLHDFLHAGTPLAGSEPIRDARAIFPRCSEEKVHARLRLVEARPIDASRAEFPALFPRTEEKLHARQRLVDAQPMRTSGSNWRAIFPRTEEKLQEILHAALPLVGSGPMRASRADRRAIFPHRPSINTFEGPHAGQFSFVHQSKLNQSQSCLAAAKEEKSRESPSPAHPGPDSSSPWDVSTVS